MIKRSREEWFCHFEAQAMSGQSMQAYCKAQGLCNRHFSQRRKQLGWQVEEKMIRTESGVQHDCFILVQIKVAEVSDGLVLHYSGLRLDLPETVSAHGLVDVLKGLS